ncbi:post-transcriptional regulator [Bacillus sp. FJAT-49711]|uniref:post-transcriptional regulator n=1 Tax=Bacillus sp. FJAT-49711 TaxID=2833585 RepID=UPI001BC9E715|nr:post-transcriptional regulator [Bacillus sp. FJAT-49711]MBS4217035.1 post-transcriptional regulator [Bacillus sp. FJAT-49711]
MDTSHHPYDSYLHVLKPALTSKAEEFAVLGYGEVKTEDIWIFLTKKKWRKHKEGIRIYELVSDVLSMKVGEFMNFATVEAFKSPDWFSDIDSDELQELLQIKE